MRPIQHKPLPWRNIEGRVVLIHPKNHKVHEFNEVGTFLWTHADGNYSLEDLSQKLSQDFQVGYQEALKDSKQFFEHLHQLELIHWM